MATEAEGPGFVGIRFCQVCNWILSSSCMIFAIKMSKTVQFLTSDEIHENDVCVFLFELNIIEHQKSELRLSDS